MKQIPAGEFKAQCLALMDLVSQTGEPVLITKHGKPMAKLVPAERRPTICSAAWLGENQRQHRWNPSLPLDDWENK